MKLSFVGSRDNCRIYRMSSTKTLKRNDLPDVVVDLIVGDFKQTILSNRTNKKEMLLVMDITVNGQIGCYIDERDQEKLHDKPDKFTNDIVIAVKAFAKGGPFLPVILVNLGENFTGLKVVPLSVLGI
jgi:hypothetical protein